MPARPRVGAAGRQEYYQATPGHFKVNGRFSSVLAHSTHAVLTKESTPLEPGTVDHKLYVRGIGVVLEQTEGGPERERAHLGHERLSRAANGLGAVAQK